ncbi:MAG: hypothetical protein AAGF67_12465, partial [Verrucomicrobiota bacterium]
FNGFLSLSFTFFLKWLLFRFLIHPKRIALSSPWAVVVFVLGSLVIWSMTKSVEMFGLILALRGDPLSYYVVFWVLSLVVMIIHMPFLLDPRRARVHQPEQISDGQAANRADS